MLGKSFMTPQHVARPVDVREPIARASILRQDRRRLNPRSVVGAVGDCLEGDFAPVAGTLGAKKTAEPSPRHDA